jgi:hypothetical protein
VIEMIMSWGEGVIAPLIMMQTSGVKAHEAVVKVTKLLEKSVSVADLEQTLKVTDRKKHRCVTM